MKSFREMVSENIQKGLNYNDIVKSFDKIEDAVIEPDGKTIRVRGTKNSKFQDIYSQYKNKEVAKEVIKKVQNLIGVE